MSKINNLEFIASYLFLFPGVAASEIRRALYVWKEGQIDDDFDFDAVDVTQKVRAKVCKYDLSGHANRDELGAFAKNLSPRALVLHHGDPEARDWFKKNLESENFDIYDPKPLQTYDI